MSHQGDHGPSPITISLTTEGVAASSGASLRTIREWARHGLLGTTVRVPSKGKRGRGENHFLARFALPAAQRLMTFRRFVSGAENAKLWLWLEGFEFPGLDESTVTAR